MKGFEVLAGRGFVAIMFEKVNDFGGSLNLGVSVADVSWVFKMAYLGDLFVMMLPIG